MARIFGHVEGVSIGDTFPNRAAVAEAGVHRQRQAGITGGGAEGAESIVLSGGYEDDRDYGDEIIYTGHGGRDTDTGRQIADQELTLQNLALTRNATWGLPVRVVRGPDPSSPYAPASGYRYDGLYRVEDFWRERGRSGFYVWRFRLVAADAEIPEADPEVSVPVDRKPSKRTEQTVLRIVRDTALSRRVKEIHEYRCQVCGIVVEGAGGPYAEGAHIRPLGAPHNGPDALDNILCLCPNHHVMFDLGGYTVADDLSLIGIPGRLRTVAGHPINVEYIRYHREHFGALVVAKS